MESVETNERKIDEFQVKVEVAKEVNKEISF